MLRFHAQRVPRHARWLLFSLSRWLERGLYPYALFLQTVPIRRCRAAFGALVRPRPARGVRLCVHRVVFPVIANTLAGLRSVDPRLSDLFRLYGAKLGDSVLKLRLRRPFRA